jgi:hypothetical protein
MVCAWVAQPLGVLHCLGRFTVILRPSPLPFWIHGRGGDHGHVNVRLPPGGIDEADVQACLLYAAVWALSGPAWHDLFCTSRAASHISNPFGQPIAQPIVPSHHSAARLADLSVMPLPVQVLSAAIPSMVPCAVLVLAVAGARSGHSTRMCNTQAPAQSYLHERVGHEVLILSWRAQKSATLATC